MGTTSAEDTRPGRLPWWVTTLLGLVGAGLGVFLVFRPFTSLSVLVAVVVAGCIVTGLTTITASRQASPRWPGALAGALWLAAGAVVVAWPDVTTGALAGVVGIALILGGVLDVVAGIRGSVDERLAAVISGLASVVFGALALSWPSVTVLVVAIVFGARLVLFGLRMAWSAFRDRNGRARTRSAPSEPGWIRRTGHVVGAVVALAVAVVLAGVSAVLNEGAPVVDAFYDTPDEVPAEPGQLLRAEPFTRTIPDDARAWRILYTTTRADGVAAVASALVVEPREPSAQPRPVIALAHGTTGVDRSCAPSVLDDPFAAGAFFALDRVVDEGWALVATDYVGLGTEGPHPYLVGEPAGRSVLDSVRAAKQLPDLQLADQTVVWGHSQGGGAALWTGVLAPSYAPDTDVIGRCLAEPAALLSVIGSIALGDDMFSTDLASGPLLARFEQNVPTAPIAAPLLIAQGASDQLVLPSVQSDYVAARCADGQDIDFRTYDGLDHVPLVEADSPLIAELVEWTTDRLGGAAPTPNCPD